MGGWHVKGHPVQAAGLNALFHSWRFNNSIFAAFKRSFTYDAHNLDVRGENELLVANYALGIRLVDTSDKTAPVEAAFYFPNANESDACKQDCGFNARATWGSYFGSDGRIYASDIGRGFFIVEQRARGVASGAALASGAAPAGRSAGDGPDMSARVASRGGTAPVRLRALVRGSGVDFAFSLTTPRESQARIMVYDVQGRLVSSKDLGTLPAGEHSVSWTPRDAQGRLPSRGIYFARVESGAAAATVKFVH